MLRSLVNVGLFQAAWWATVLGVAGGQEEWAYGATALLLIVHLGWVRREAGEAIFLLLVAALGFLVDSLLVARGVLEASGWTPVASLGPAWLFCLWLDFASLARVSLQWLQARPGLAAFFGAVGGPATYWGGEQLGALRLGSDQGMVLAILAMTWAALMVGIMKLARWRGWGRGAR